MRSSSAPAALLRMVEQLWRIFGSPGETLLILARETVDHFWSSWRFVVDAFTAVQTAVSRLSARDCALSMRDHAWLMLAVLLRPFIRTPGFFERRCLARALRIGPPRFKVEVKAVETCTVNNGNNLLRGTLWLPSGRDAVGPFPAVVIRSPYGAQDQNADWGNIVLAERGYAVLLQDTRGRFGSDGSFVPVEHEREDGKETVRWVRAQPWCDGRIAVFGPSYLGLTAWACVGACEPGEVQALVPVITQAVVRPAVFGEGGSISLELLVLWFYLIEIITHKSPVTLCRALYRDWRQGRLLRASMQEPLGELDLLLFGKRWDFFQRGVQEPHSDDGPFWSARSTLCELRPDHPDFVIPPPLHMVTGWYDFFARQSLQDYERAAAVQPACQLTVMPYEHWGFTRLYGMQLSYRCLLQCMLKHLPTQRPSKQGAQHGASRDAAPPPLPVHEWFSGGRSESSLAQPVQLCLLGSLRWYGMPSWPPPRPKPLHLWLGSALTLRRTSPKAAASPLAVGAVAAGSWPSPSCVVTPGTALNGSPLMSPGTAPDFGVFAKPIENQDAFLTARDRARAPAPGKYTTLEYTYVPREPTPARGGPSFHPLNSGAIDQSPIERREDLLVFTSEPLREPLAFAGTPVLVLRVWTSSRSIDLVGRLCFVTRHGASINLCEGLSRVNAAAEEACIGDADWRAGRLVEVELGPVAAELGVGERLRLHVCSAAHPRWMRNLCSSPEIPLAQQTSGSSASCCVRVSVDDEASVLTLPLLETAPAR